MLSVLRWDEREPYEKAVMAAIAGAMVLAVLWFVLINPVLSAKSDARLQSDKAQRDYNIVSRALPQLGAGAIAANGEPFSQKVLITTARTKSIRLTRVQPDEDAVNVWIDDVETGKLYSLINTLVTENSAELSRATITTSESGLLSAQLTLE